ncbi:MAG: 4Fe-4S ferredoxin iron-sulfur binding domain protein [Desulfomicrobiaceae bacterium]|jgi:ferredoxin|nr:4Fe-4S binding protein [Desulfomicrobiaceae bacterium]MBZ4684673.1 4Fe-4S ferredoxin iron-sulfur binding domain protein [Desulfomicrobiaceae bacterium]MDI3492795.1 L-aspartate semialdehyde sulfurtransferase ferredoxin [Desulfomicrobiaceae bacterium]MDK2872657.1 L-aspartate semialdehyde sulfurtransferase ferredoxin [Desulfomicrobiaceae bacterium]HCF04747.1 (Fe-S)-binding protein [Desulfomicrobiaceae bacterium]
MTTHEVSRIVSLRFSPETSGRPMMYHLAKRFDLTFNILQASINPRQEGHMILELAGTRENYTQGISYLQEHGIRVTPVANQITRNEESCMHCGMCTAMCPSKALHLDLETRRVEFDRDKCTACNQCTLVCPVHAMQVLIDPDDLVTP